MHAPRAADVVAGVTVGLVLVPQSLAYARVAGMPPVTGLYAAALPSIAAAAFASSRYLQTGPVGMTALLTFAALTPLAATGSSTYVGLALLLAICVGVIRISIGLFRLGRVAYLMSPAVLAGFVPAAAVLIIASQAESMTGVDGRGRSILGSAIQASTTPREWRVGAVGFALATIACILAGRRLEARIPWILVATVSGVIIARHTSYGGTVIGRVPQTLPRPSLNLPWDRLGAVLVPAMVIAVLGFAEAASIARTYATIDRDRWQPDREFVSQGVASLTSGVFGGFPVGGSFSRTSLNRLAGGRTQWSGAVAGAVVLIATQLTGSLATLPVAVLGGIITASIVSLAWPKELIRITKLSRPQGVIAIATFVATLWFAPSVQYGVLIGVGLSIGNHLLREFPVDISVDINGGEIALRPRGALWFGSAERLEDVALDSLAANRQSSSLLLDLRGIGRVDLTGALVLKSLIDDAAAAGLETQVIGAPPRSQRVLRAVLGQME